mgnify:CR=1 FL=1
MRKLSKTLLSLLLIAAMLASFVVLPAAAEEPAAEQPTEAVQAAETQADDAVKTNYELSIVMLDCGRKYFSVDSIKQIIDNASAAGFGYIMLGVGNDGMRFLLDDMSLTVNGTTYESDAVKSAIHAGNEAYYNFAVDELTQSEMDAVLAYAKEKGMGVIPMLNTPGHMDAILAAATSLTGTNCSYNGSVRTIDVTNNTAVTFTQELLKKYVAYFAGKGCQYFNMGADEYANDKYDSGSMGFGNLQSTGKYSYYVEYVNAVAALIKNAGMTPMAFNDGIYFNYVTSSGTFDTDIVICYWSNGWGGYTPMSAEALASKGFKMVNTHGDYYWVLGKTNAQCSDTKAAGFDYTSFPGGTVSNPKGAMFCIWADYPGAETEASVISKTAATIKAFGKTLPDTSAVEKWKTVSEDNTVYDEATGVSVTAPGLTKVEVTEKKDNLPELPEGASAMLAWDIKPYVGNEAYSGEATVTLKIPTAWSGANVYGAVVNEDGSLTSVKGDNVALDETNSTITFTVPHFSTVLAVKENKSNTIDVTLGKEQTFDLRGDRVGKDGKVDLPENEFVSGTLERYEKPDEAKKKLGAKVTNVENNTDYLISDGSGHYLSLNGTTIKDETDINKATVWTAAKENSGISLNDGKYYLRYSRNYYDFSYSLTAGTTTTNNSWTYSNGSLYYKRSSRTSYYINQSGSEWSLDSSSGNGALYSFEKVKVYGTTLTIKGNKVGTTTLTLGNETYTINVNYKQQPVDAVVGETTTVDVSGTLDTTGLDTTIAEVTIAGNKMTVKGLKEGNTSVRVGDTEYKINVSNIDLSTVTPLTIEYWITNARAKDKNGATVYTLAATTAHKEEGVDIATFLPQTLEKDTRNVAYWRGRLLDTTKTNSSTSGTEKQTTDEGDDDTYSGTEYKKVRYWNGTWAVYTENNEWVSVLTTHQLVAYYLEILPVADELNVNAADWGKKGDGSTSGDYLVPETSCTVSVQVIYEDGTTNPKTTAASDLKSSTIAYGYWTGGRGIGTMMLSGLDGYQIWKIEAETGAETYSSASTTWGSYTVDSFTWDNNAMTVYEGEPVDSYVIHNDAHSPSKEGYYANLMWDENHEAILIKVYVKAEIKEDSLKVHYVNLKGNSEFYTYAINVPEGTTFDSQLAMDPASETYLVHNTVVNTNGIQQTVNGNLSTMSEIGAQYRYGGFTLKEVKLENGYKEVWLYYDFQNEHVFVVDFGVPVHIMPSDINVAQSGWSGAKVDGKETSVGKYGTATVGVGKGLTYTATKPMLGVETFTVTLEFTGSDNKTTGLTYLIYLVPATTVYYEQNVATYSDGWSLNGTAIAADKYQETQKGRTAGCNFGYDPYYKENQLGANGSVMYTTTPGESAQLTFKGTGMELYLRTQNANATSDPATEANNAANHSYMLVQVYAGDTADANSLKRMSFVDVNNLFVQHGTDKYGYNTPCWTVDGMTYGTYTAVVRYVKGTTYGLAIDGFRVTNTLNPDNAKTKDFYAAVGEAGMQTAEIRNMVIANAQTNLSFDAYSNANEMYRVTANKVLDAVFDESDKITGAVILTNDSNGTNTVQVDKELLNIGPKNEIYLKNGQAVVMQIPTTYTTVQVGMRSLTGAEVSYKINGTSDTMKSTVDMYYKVTPAAGKLVIQNVSGGILALTKLKVTSKTAATADDSGVIPQTTPEAIRYAMALMRGIDVPQFTDVPEGAWYHDYVYDLVYRGVVNGMTATTYEPEGKLTRAQFVKLLACSLADAETLKTYEGKHPFKDSEGHWAEAYIAWAKDKGIVEGVSATEFDPEAPITREQMATIFGRYALKQGIELPKSENAAGSFPDADKISEYAREFVELMRIAGILNGYEDGTFRPQGNATRAEAAKLFSLFLSITDKLAK